MSIMSEPLIFSSGSSSSGDDTPTVVYINFTLDGTTYQAEEGMTWTEWVNSSYCSSGLQMSVSGNYVYMYNGSYYVYDGAHGAQTHVSSNVAIEANAVYYKSKYHVGEPE